jgi:ferredoxin
VRGVHGAHDACRAGRAQGGSVSRHLVVDPIACTGHGLCAELFPEWIELDEWGYPIIEHGPIPEELLSHAHRAADACPKLALRVSAADQASDPRIGSRSSKPADPSRTT